MAEAKITKLLKLSEPVGANLIGYMTPIESVIRTVADKLADTTSVKDFGAKGDGVADDTAAISAMALARGYIIFPEGQFRIGANYTIDVPQYYRDGASLIIDTVATLTITNRIYSCNQWIFKGDGPVIINIVSTMGEDAKLITAGWFGVFPTNALVTDVTARIQRALNSMNAQTREGILQLECGSYHVSGTMYVPRGVQIAGRGMRRTIFDVSGLNFTIFETAGNACKFTDFQFEYPTGQAGVRTAPYIHVKHNTCDIENIWLYPTTIGIIVDQPQCYIRNIRATLGLDPRSAGVADTSLIWVRSSSFTIDQVLLLNTTYSPHHIVRVGYDSTISVGNITNIQSSQSANAVFFDGRNCTITRVNVASVLASPSSGTQFEGVIKVVTTGAFIVSYLNLNGLIGNAYADSLVHLEAADTSIIEHISIGCSSVQASSAYGLRLLNSSTTAIRYINVGDDVDVTGRTTRLQKVGLTSFLTIPASMKGSQYTNVTPQNMTIADDAIAIIEDSRTAIFAGILIIGSSNSSIYGIYSFRSASSSNHVTLITGHANMAASTANLTGTTGTDGKFTVGINTSGQLVLENRVGVSATFCVVLMAGL